MQPVRVGLVGLGNFGALYSEVLSSLPGVELKAFASTSPSQLEAFGHRFAVKKLYNDYEDMVQSSDLDAIFITSRSEEHAKQALMALEAGKHVFVEKPLALSYEDAEAIVKRAREKCLHLQVGFLLRYDRRMMELKQWVESGRLGSLVYMAFQRSYSRVLNFGGSYSDPVRETMSHDIDLALWLAGSLVRKVSARRAAPPGERPQAFLALVSFANGVEAMFQADWLIPRGAPINLLETTRTLDASCKFVGTDGRAHVQLLDDGLTIWSHDRVIHPLTGIRDRVGGRLQGALTDQVLAFLETVRTGRTSPVASLDDALYGLKVCTAILTAAAEDREIEVE